MKKILTFLLTLIVTLSLVSCAQPVSADVVMSNKPRISAPDTTPAELAALASGNSVFAFELYQNLRKSEGNLFYSPYSISTALAMTYAGARGDTEKQMADVLNFTLAQNRLHPAFNKLDIELESRGQGAEGKDEKGFRLNNVNAIWGQKDFTFLPDYLDVLAQNYGAGLRIVDYINRTEKARITINDWVAQQTEDKIKDLLPQGSIDTLTRLVLTNAIYFNAAWEYQFDEKTTQNAPFILTDGSSVTVPMMRQTAPFGFYGGDNFKAVELPYSGRELSMVIIVPDEGQFAPFESSLTAEQVQKIIGEIKPGSLMLSMPRFKFESQFGLKDELSAMGMPVAFSETEADFSGMDGKRDLLIKDVVHKAYVSVDEAGTEAAAATAVIVGTTSLPPELTIDRPFIFLIRDIETGTMLFIGRVLNPTK